MKTDSYDMKSLKNIYKLAFVLPALMLAGCSDENEPSISGTDDFEIPSELTLTLSVPDHEVVNLGTRAADPAITSITVFCYDQTGTSGNHLQHTTLTSGWEVSGNGYKITVPIHKQTKSVHLVVNAPVRDTDTDPVNIVSKNPDAGIMWGRADLRDIITKTKDSSITMIRNTAKVSVKNEASDFTYSGFAVTGTSAAGTVAPSGWNTDPTTPTIPSGTATNTAATLQPASAEIRIFETEADSPKSGASEQFVTRGRIIIEGTYQGVKGYYTVAFRTRSGSGSSEGPGNYHYTPIPVLRNHHYTVNVKEVRAKGWATIEEAAKAEPDNRLTVEITDKTPEITDIIADRDYMLGVGDDVEVAWDATTAQIAVATSWNGTHASTGKPYEVTVLKDDKSLVILSDPSKLLATVSEASSTVTDYGTTGQKITTYILNIDIAQNSSSNVTRTADLTVRSGDLTRTVKIIQTGRNYKRDPNRAVTLVGLPNATINNWFKFVDDDCKGLHPDDSYNNQERDQGLIFPAVPAYTLIYYIPKLTGDSNQKITGAFSYSEVTDNGKTQYRITANSTSEPTITVGEFTVDNSFGATIRYPLYQTGYLHQLTSATDTYQREDEKINGWFYYEVVRVGNSYILDRNLGASSNKPYISTYAGFSSNKNAIGAYFKIATEKSTDEKNPKTIIGNLGLSNFTIPTENDINSWGIKALEVDGISGENALVATINVSGQYSKIYLPHGGYYEATSPKYETHANVWTKTLLAGNQGFSPTSPEFGYWYLYVDVYGKKTSFSQIRFANGSSGMVPTESSVYKYMPIRLIWQ